MGTVTTDVVRVHRCMRIGVRVCRIGCAHMHNVLLLFRIPACLLAGGLVQILLLFFPKLHTPKLLLLLTTELQEILTRADRCTGGTSRWDLDVRLVELGRGRQMSSVIESELRCASDES